MREMVLTIDYQRQSDPLGEVLASHTKTQTKSLMINITDKWCWKCEYATGGPAGIDALHELLDTGGGWQECFLAPKSAPEYQVDILEQSRDHLVAFVMWQRTPVPSSIPELAYTSFGPGLLMEVRRSGNTATWHFAFQKQEREAEFLSALMEGAASSTTITVERTSGIKGKLVGEPVLHEQLPPEQQAALEEATNRGYYEIPRECTLDELATEIDISPSTVSYRLRRAEAFLIKKFLASVPPFTSISAGNTTEHQRTFEQYLKQS